MFCPLFAQEQGLSRDWLWAALLGQLYPSSSSCQGGRGGKGQSQESRVDCYAKTCFDIYVLIYDICFSLSDIHVESRKMLYVILIAKQK